jgi:hypothetical protein
MQNYLNDWMRELSFAFMSENSQNLINHLDDESNKRYFILTKFSQTI